METRLYFTSAEWQTILFALGHGSDRLLESGLIGLSEETDNLRDELSVALQIQGIVGVEFVV